jgi:hypothetical protein
MRKLSDADVAEIRSLLAAGVAQAVIAKKYGVRIRLISDLKRGWDYRIDKDIPKSKPRVIKGIDPKDLRKLSAIQVRLVRKELALGTPVKHIARMVGVGVGAIRNIRDGVTYKDVK